MKQRGTLCDGGGGGGGGVSGAQQANRWPIFRATTSPLLAAARRRLAAAKGVEAGAVGHETDRTDFSNGTRGVGRTRPPPPPRDHPNKKRRLGQPAAAPLVLLLKPRANWAGSPEKVTAVSFSRPLFAPLSSLLCVVSLFAGLLLLVCSASSRSAMTVRRSEKSGSI